MCWEGVRISYHSRIYIYIFTVNNYMYKQKYPKWKSRGAEVKLLLEWFESLFYLIQRTRKRFSKIRYFQHVNLWHLFLEPVFDLKTGLYIESIHIPLCQNDDCHRPFKWLFMMVWLAMKAFVAGSLQSYFASSLVKTCCTLLLNVLHTSDANFFWSIDTILPPWRSHETNGKTDSKQCTKKCI